MTCARLIPRSGRATNKPSWQPSPFLDMNLSPLHYARALFRAARGLLLRRRQHHVAEVHVHRKEPPRVSLFQGIMETALLTVPDPEPVGWGSATVPPVADRPTPKASGFLRLEVDTHKKATGSFLLFSEGQVLTGTVEGAASEAWGRHVETSFRVPPSVARKLRAGQTAPVAVRCLRFQACDH